MGGKAALDGTVQGHLWNCVWIGGAPYHLDVTWDNTLTRQGGPIRYDYMNMTDAEVARDHFDYHAPACTERQWGYFIREGLQVSGKGGLNVLLKEAVSRGTKSLTFKILPGKTGYPPDLEPLCGVRFRRGDYPLRNLYQSLSACGNAA